MVFSAEEDVRFVEPRRIGLVCGWAMTLAAWVRRVANSHGKTLKRDGIIGSCTL